MNCIERAHQNSLSTPKKLAIWTEKDGVISFEELFELSRRAQSLFHAYSLKPGDSVLLLALPGPLLYASVLGLIAAGASVLLVEPWMPIANINHVVQTMNPKLFLTGTIGKIWGLRVPAIRKIPHWISIQDIGRQAPLPEFVRENVARDARAIITFSSGTTGMPKGIVRTHGYLHDMHAILTRDGTVDMIPDPDLSVFANVALFHLSTGRGALVVPHGWKAKSIARIAELPRSIQPATLSCGPGFLKQFLKIPGFQSLRSIYVGGALTDRWILEEGFKRWPETNWTHIYGGSEAEPVSLADARKAVKLCAEKNHFQTLFIGDPIHELKTRLAPEGLWVCGPNVCPEYLGAPEENAAVKKRDSEGNLWHFMGDRVRSDDEGWWYAGRSAQPETDFTLEQKVYSFLQSSASFVHRMQDGKLILLGQNLKARKNELNREFPEIARIEELKIIRDHRHRARIDRVKSIRKGAKWLVG